MVALLVVFPVSLILESLNGLSILVGRPFNRVKLDRWLTILQIGVVPVMLSIGLIFGVLAGGTSQHFRTPHGISGLVLTVSSFVSNGLSFVRRRTQGKSDKAMTARRTAFEFPPDHKKLLLADRLVISFTLILVLGVWVTGIIDLRSISFCLVDQVSMVTVAVAGAILNWFWEAALVVMCVDWWLGRRSQGKTRRTVDGEQPLISDGVYSAQPSPMFRTYLSPYNSASSHEEKLPPRSPR